MEKKINEALMQYVVKPKSPNPSSTVWTPRAAALLEVIGLGYGKSLPLRHHPPHPQARTHGLREYNPRIFSFNQMRNMVRMLTGIDETRYMEIVEASAQYHLSNKYDFFFYLTEQLNAANLFSSQLVLVDNCNVLDEYTMHFMEYLVQDSTDGRIVFLAFTTEPTFLFSEKIRLGYLDNDEIQQVLGSLFDSEATDLAAQGEVLLNITGGNLFIIERLLNRFYAKGKPKKFELTNYLDDKLSVEGLFAEMVVELTPRQHQLAVLIFLMDSRATEEQIFEHFDDKPLDKDLEALEANGMVQVRNNRLIINKTAVFRDYYLTRPPEEQRKTVREFLKNADDLNISPLSQTYYHYLFRDAAAQGGGAHHLVSGTGVRPQHPAQPVQRPAGEDRQSRKAGAAAQGPRRHQQTAE
jgi:hypothetical protein